MRKTEQLNQIIEKRFNSFDDKQLTSRLSAQMHMDLLMVFHDEKDFEFETFAKYDLKSVLDYLEATHRYYLSEVFPKINYAIESLGNSRENLSGLKMVLEHVFAHLEEDLVHHMADEEKGLFPYVKKLLNENYSDIYFHESYLDQFIQDHDDNCETILEELISLLNNKIQEFPNFFSLTILRNHLEFFKRDLTVHSLIEEKVLVPMTRELENKLKK